MIEMHIIMIDVKMIAHILDYQQYVEIELRMFEKIVMIEILIIMMNVQIIVKKQY
jgi:hypothetical protein